MPPTMLIVPLRTFCRSVMLAEVSRMSLKTRCDELQERLARPR